MTQEQMAEIDREQQLVKREDLLDAIDAYGTASVAYGKAIFGDPMFKNSFLDTGARKDKAYEVVLNIVYRLLS